MGAAEPAVGERANEAGAAVGGTVLAQNTGKCVEEPLQPGEVALHIGCGRCYWNGWVNVDLDLTCDEQWDIRKPPHPDNSVDRIAAIHVFEHLYRWEVEDALQEWKRVLKPGGSIVLELPSMDTVLAHIGARLRKGQAPAEFMSWLPLWGDPKYKDPAMCHKWGYFRRDMQLLLERAGFTNIQQEEARYHFPIRDMRVSATK